MTSPLPGWLDPSPWTGLADTADARAVERALRSDEPGERELAALLSPAAGHQLEALARRAQALTRRHFGRTIQLYAPLYLSNYCSGGCAYCGFASDRSTPRHKLTPDELESELSALRAMGIEEILLLTGERSPEVDFAAVRGSVERAARRFPRVSVEVFPMSREEYHELTLAGCTGVTLYQETYDPARYDQLHRWGPKRDYAARLEGPACALGGGMRTVGLGALLGLGDPVFDMLCLYRHARFLRSRYWKAGVAISFPRVCPQAGGYQPAFPVDGNRLAQIICAFRIALPDVPLVLSTRERPTFRDGMAGVGICQMSVASRTTVGGYGHDVPEDEAGQFDTNDPRDVPTFCAMLRARDLEPVFKNWDAVYRVAGKEL